MSPTSLSYEDPRVAKINHTVHKRRPANHCNELVHQRSKNCSIKNEHGKRSIAWNGFSYKDRLKPEVYSFIKLSDFSTFDSSSI